MSANVMTSNPHPLCYCGQKAQKRIRSNLWEDVLAIWNELSQEIQGGSFGSYIEICKSYVNYGTMALTTLDLMNNSIGSSGAWALHEALKTHSALTTLDLRYNSIGDDEAHALSEALKTNSTLTILKL
ncbi:hypothetical protein CPC16_000344 [Podila verticillata]|nr:hypothetical protein CPC16_000344 [Podila verticillata]